MKAILLLEPGRIYYFRVPSREICLEMVADFTKRAELSKRRADAKSRFERNQERARLLFNSTPFQCFFASLIFLVSPQPSSLDSPLSMQTEYDFICCGEQNFVINAAQAQLNERLSSDSGPITPVGIALDRIDVVLTCM